jgi:hypothetical protein
MFATIGIVSWLVYGSIDALADQFADVAVGNSHLCQSNLNFVKEDDNDSVDE